MIRVLDLFSGIGGFSLGLERAGMQTKAFCEIDPYCCKVLAKNWPGVPIHNDIKQLDGSQYVGAVDVICGGYPCQPFSAAGKQQGEADPRHLWPEMHRIIRQACPRWVIAENVRGHVSLGFDAVAAQLEDDGFTVWPFIVPACAVGAPHRRDRLWIVANNQGSFRITPAAETHAGTSDRESRDGFGCRGQIMGHAPSPRLHAAAQAGVHRQEESGGPRNEESQRRSSALAYADSQPLVGPSIPRQQCDPGDAQPGLGRGHDGLSSGLDFPTRWANGSWEQGIARIASGVPDRVHRLKALGNAVVPQIPELIGRAIMEFERIERKAA